jgi:hypothetical protein
MSYYEARTCFNKNLQLIGRPQNKTENMAWNLSSGLNEMTQALEAHLGQIHALLTQIVTLLQHRR